MHGRASLAGSLLAALLFLGVAATRLAPSGGYFGGNFATYWMPPALALLIVAFATARPTVLLGAALALTMFLWLYSVWVASLTKAEGLIWLGYVSAMPGAVLGGVVAGWLVGRERLVFVGGLFVAFATVSAGLAINVGLLCTTLMRCSA